MRLILLMAVSAICFSASLGAKFRPEAEHVDGSFCQGCKSIVSFMSRFNSSTKREENKELIEKFCETYYPVSTDFRLGPCPIFVEGFFEVLGKIDPANQCDKMGACGPNNSTTQILAPGSQDNLDAPEGGVCDLCTDVVKQVKAQLEDPRLLDKIHHIVDAFCEYLKVVDADKQCRTALESYIDQALDFIKKMKPKELCRSIQLCPPNDGSTNRISTQPEATLPSLADFLDFGIETSVQVGGQQVKSVHESMDNSMGIKAPLCMFCKQVVKEMFKFLKDNKTEENIRYVLDQGCELIYKDQEKLDHCEDLVKAYSKELLELLADETDPGLICMLLGQCSYQTRRPINRISGPESASKPSMRRPSSVIAADKPITMSQLISMLDPTIQVDSMRSCVECKLFIKYLQETIEQPSSQEEIRIWLLNNLCNNMGDSDLAKSCTKFVNQESPIFFKALMESLDPKSSCEYLGACTARVRSNYLADLRKHLQTHRVLTPVPNRSSSSAIRSKRPLGGPMCDQCVDIVTRIDDYLSTHPIDHDIDVLKDKVCNTIQDDNLRGECVMIIQTFGQEIIQAISNMDNPRQLCQQIYLCSANN